ncbi:serine hydrolase domain-containing protein [Rubripirellula reticaptiva]|nr:serine hydrolase domain-containing protein [Rubripirellula reticaptiva]
MCPITRIKTFGVACALVAGSFFGAAFADHPLVQHGTTALGDVHSENETQGVVNDPIVLDNDTSTGTRPDPDLSESVFGSGEAAYNVSSGPKDERFAVYDRSMREFMKEHRIPGASIAVTNRGKVVFARGYGYADVSNGEQVNPDSLFRIASISKPITAVAILQLIEKGKLSLDDCVFAILDYEVDIIAAGDAFDQRCRGISIRHLLEHRGGWDRDKSFDAMFQSVRFAEQVGLPPPADQSAVIKAMLQQELDFEPGHRHAYSNFGYCLLGRVVEKISGMTYENYVKKNVLEPVGIGTMRIGATRLSGRADREVRYYHPGTGRSVFSEDLGGRVPWPYGAWNLEAMDSHGGWIASATDLAKFAAAFDDPDACPILSRNSIEKMYSRPPGLAGHDTDGKQKARYYSLGWSNRVVDGDKINHWHSGSLNGTASVMIRRHDGKNFIALLNTRVSPLEASVSSEIDRLLHKMANGVKDWPE